MSGPDQLPDQYKHLAGRKGMKTIGHVPIAVARDAVRHSVPTMHHAIRVFESAVAAFGDDIYLEQVDGQRWRRVFRIDGDLLVPTPVLELVKGKSGITGPVIMIGGDQSPPAAPNPEKFISRIAPKGKDMHEGKIEFREGPSRFEVVYGEDGRFKETCTSSGDWFSERYLADVQPFQIDTMARPPTTPPVSVFCQPDLSPHGHRVDDFAQLLTCLHPGRNVPARVWMPVPLPCGISGVLGVGIAALRRASWDGALSDTAAWAMADGLEGTVLIFGDDSGQLRERFRAEVASNQPLPEPLRKHPERPTSLAERRQAKTSKSSVDQDPRLVKNGDGQVVGISTGTIRLGGGLATSPPAWPELGPDNTPGLLVPVPDRWVPDDAAGLEAAGFSRPVRLVGKYGEIMGGVVRQNADGWTLLGQGVADVIDLENLDRQIADALTQHQEIVAEFDSMREDPFDRSQGCELTVFACFDSGQRLPIPLRLRSQSWRGQWDPAHLDADEAAWTVTHFRRPGG